MPRDRFVPRAPASGSGVPSSAWPVTARLLGVDLGERRVGLAIADSEASPARPLVTIRRTKTVDADGRQLARVCLEQGITELVVGLPLEASGVEGPMAAAARAWAAAIAGHLALPVTLRDERLSSFVAESRIGPMKRGRSGGPPTAAQREAYRARVDREAAAVILQDELDARRLAAGEPASVMDETPAPIGAGR